MATATASLIKNFRVLVLNASYEPLKIVSWQKALTLWFQDKVDVLEYHSAAARSVNRSFEIPSILRLKKYVKMSRTEGVKFCRENIYIRDSYTCQYCSEKLNYKDLTIDHVLPVSQGGGKNWKNIVTACRPCNQKKANRTPEKAKMPLLNKPKEPLWLPIIDIYKIDHLTEKNPSTWNDYLNLNARNP